MSMRSTFARCIAYTAFLCPLLLTSSLGHGQQCTRRALLATDADVYRLPPRYVTGAGWQGDRVDVLNRGTQVLQCATRSVAFGFSSKTWSQVAYRGGKDWSYGWILEETLRFVSSGRGLDSGFSGAPRVMPVSYRLAAAEEAAKSPEWTIGDAAPPPPPVSLEPAKTPLQAPVNAPSLWEQLALYWPLFAAMLLGMAAKAAVDLVDEWDKALVIRHLRNGVVAFLVSPIVFLGFLNAGKFDGSEQTFLVLADPATIHRGWAPLYQIGVASF